jgi:hypothetical protein
VPDVNESGSSAECKGRPQRGPGEVVSAECPAPGSDCVVMYGWPARYFAQNGYRQSICIAVTLYLVLTILSVDPWQALLTAITNGTLFAVLAGRRWPHVPASSRPTTELRVSPAGLVVGVRHGRANLLPWSRVEEVSLKRTSAAGLCRLRVRCDRADMIAACDPEMIGPILDYINACRSGHAGRAPYLTPCSRMTGPIGGGLAQDGVEVEADAIRLRQCPECSFDLAGVSAQGQCPECGFRFDARSLVALYGWNPERPSEFSWWQACLLLLGLLIGCWLVPPILISRLGMPAGLSRLLPLGLVGVCAAVFYQRRFVPRGRAGSAHFPLWGQLRLTRDGFGVRAGYGPCPLHPWSNRVYLHIDPIQDNTYKVRVTGSPEDERSPWVWAKLDIEADSQTVQEIVKRVAHWRRQA